MHIIVNTKLGKLCLFKYSVDILLFSLINVLVASVFTFLAWFRKHSGHIFSCCFLKRCGDQVGRLVRDLTVHSYVVTFLSFALLSSVFLSLLCLSFFFSFFSLDFLSFFFFYVASKTRSARVPKSFI